MKRKVLFIHNKYAKFSGEEASVIKISNLLINNGYLVFNYYRTSEGLDSSFFQRINAVFSNFFNLKSFFDIRKIINDFNPDLIQVQNLYPFISPSILWYLKRKGIPVIMRSPNYRIFCSNGLFLRLDGKICELCAQTKNDFYGFRYNCAGNHFKSFVYSLRTFIFNFFNVFNSCVSAFVVQSNFQKRKFISYGIDENKIFVLRGFEELTGFTSTKYSENKRNSFVYIGRLSFEKGFFDFLELAKLNPDLKFKVIGDDSDVLKEYRYSNIEFLGFVPKIEIPKILGDSAGLIVPSRCYEGFPNVVLTGMASGIPVICSRVGVLEEIIRNNFSGYLFPVGDIVSLGIICRNILEFPFDVEQIVNNAKEELNNNYSLISAFIQLESIYNDVVFS